ncbi:DUF4349 domain-containing protein [Lachnospiraceae bacterium ZAX-1]
MEIMKMFSRNIGSKKSSIVKKMTILTILWVGCSLFAGCGGSASSNGASKDAAVAEEAYPESSVADSAEGIDGGYSQEVEVAYDDSMANAKFPAKEEDGTVSNPQVETGRKLIKNADLRVETESMDVLMPAIKEKVDSLGGYIEYLDEGNGGYYGGYKEDRYASITVRIPADQLDGFLNLVGEISNVTSRNENVQDVTLVYVDLESHKKMLLAEQESLLSLLETAKKIEDIITIESRLSEVRYQIESMESQLRTYDNQISYSTVTITINEVGHFTPVEKKSAYERIATGFSENVYRLGQGALNLLIWFIIHIPYLIIWAIIILAVIFIIKGARKSIQKKKRKMKGVNPPAQTEAEQPIQTEGNPPVQAVAESPEKEENEKEQ